MNLLISTDALHKKVLRIKDTGLHRYQLCADSKYKVLPNNYPIIVVGCLDMCQQFDFIVSRVSNKED